MMRRPGFTLLETALAATIGGMVILATIGLFGLMNRSERALERQFTETRQLGTLQQVLRRSFNTVLMSEDTGTSLEASTGQDDQAMGTGEIVEDEEPVWDGTGERPRVVLELDTTEDLARSMMLAPPPAGDPMGMPQRLEMVLPRSPIPAALRLPTQGWMAAGIDVENDLEVYGISGSVRGVLELRPDGSREKLLERSGMGVAGGERERRDEQTGWTLWWRPVFPEEVARLALGIPESEADMLAAAAEAYPVVRQIKRARFLAFDNRFRRLTYAARTATDLPAYFEIEIETWSGQYANWMFEVGWLNGPDPTAPQDQADATDADGTPQDTTDAPGGGAGQGQENRLGTQRQRAPVGRPGSIEPQRRPVPPGAGGETGDGQRGGGA